MSPPPRHRAADARVTANGRASPLCEVSQAARIMTVMQDRKFVSRDWNDGFCDPANTSPDDIERLTQGTCDLLSAGGALFAPRPK